MELSVEDLLGNLCNYVMNYVYYVMTRVLALDVEVA